MTKIAGVPVLVLCVFGTFAAAQSDRPVRVRVDVVPVTVIVTDEQGKPVTHLGKDDFSVFENGVKQEIKHFQVLGSGEAPTGDRQLADTAGFPGGHHQRSFLIVLGRGRYARVFDETDDFVRTKLSSGDQVAIVAHGFATPFLNDPPAVSAILSRCRARWATIEQRLEQVTRSELAVVYGGPPEAQVEGLVREMLGECRRILPIRPDLDRLERRRADRQVVEYEEAVIMQRRMDQTPIPADNAKYRKFDRLQSETMRHRTGSGDFLRLRAAAEDDLQTLFASVEYFRTAPGDRHLLFFTNYGLVLPGLLNPDVPGNVACLASDAGVRIHAIHIKGPDQQGYALSDIGFAALGSMKELSELSGGQAFVTADVPLALSSVLDGSGTLYLLGYTPEDQRVDGRFRKIRIELAAKNVRVFSRAGYYASPFPTGAQAHRDYLRTISGLNSPTLLDDIRLIVNRLTYPTTPNRREVRLEMTMQVCPEMFGVNAGQYAGNLSVAYFFLSEDGQVVGQTWDSLNMNVKEATYRQVLKTGVNIVGNLPVPQGVRNGQVKVVVYSPQADLLGTVVQNWKR